MSTTGEDVLDIGPDAPEGSAPDPDAERVAEQRRIDDEFKEAARERSRIQETASRLLEAAQRMEAQAQLSEPQAEGKPPARDDFDTYEAYLEAKLEHQKKDVQRHVDTAVERALAVHREESESSSVRARMQEAGIRGEEAYPGFSDIVAKVPALPVAAMTALREIEDSEHVAYHLGTHIDEAKAIGRMTPARAAHAIIALGDRLQQERKKPKDEDHEFGPKPGGKPPQSGIRPDMDMESYAKARIQEKLRLQKG